MFAELAARLPDRPEWVEMRGMLLSGRCELVGARGPSPEDFAIRGTDFGLFAVSGEPGIAPLAKDLFRHAGRAVLCAPEGAARIASALPGWAGVRALVYVQPDGLALPRSASSGGRIGILSAGAAASLDHVPPLLREELVTALGFTHIAAAFVDGLPVSFCYAGYETEKYWDVSIDTLPAHRGRGLARECCDFLIDHMYRHGKEPVWGALEGNVASRRLAASLKFEPAGEMVVFQPPEESAG